MARTFNDSASNYMSRGSVNLGLNGVTEFSMAYWISLTAVNATLPQRVCQKQIADGWSTVTSYFNTNTAVPTFSPENQTLAQSPTWDLTEGITVGTWTRVLFTWKRNAIAASDGVIYKNGSPVPSTYTANGYTAALVLEETSNNLHYGIRPVSLTQPLNASLSWVCIWNRQLTSQEAYDDFRHPLNVTSGLVHRVQLSPDTDGSGNGNDMSVTGTLATLSGPREETLAWSRA